MFNPERQNKGMFIATMSTGYDHRKCIEESGYDRQQCSEDERIRAGAQHQGNTQKADPYRSPTQQ